MSNQVLFDDDIKKINNAVQYYPLGSYQIGEIAKLSGLLYREGVDVVKELEKLCHKHGTEKIYKGDNFIEQSNINQIEYLVKAIAPQYPLKYEDVMYVISTYFQECSLLGVSYSRDEIDRRLQNYCRGGY